MWRCKLFRGKRSAFIFTMLSNRFLNFFEDCISGAYCNVQNQYYSQCIPGTATGTVSTSPATTNPPPVTATTTTSPTPTLIVDPPPNAGFIKTNGTRFSLNGSKYTVVGYVTISCALFDGSCWLSSDSGNAYWVGLSGLSTTDMNKAFADVAKAGGTTLRTWYVELL